MSHGREYRMFSLVGNALCVNCRIVVNSWQILMLHRSGECSVAYLRPNMTTVPKISNRNMIKFPPPPSRGFLFGRLPRVAARASCSLPNAATGHAHRHDAVYVELGFLGLQTSYTCPARANPEGGSRLGSAECDPGTNRGTESYIPDPQPYSCRW